jgi:hypothetical protein
MNIMKKCVFLIACFLFASVGVIAQQSPAPQMKKKEVAVINWGGRTVTLLPTFWTAGMDEELLRQLTPEKIMDIKANSEERSWPDGFAVNKRSKHTHTTATLEEKLSKLKMYQIATFNNIRNGQNFGEMSVVMVSPEENKEWDPQIKWTKDLYFLFYSSDLKVKD